ncbi:acyltransferase family protein [Caenimonas aquaedulcis]|uniref:Acyltransferase n=1 Tax=Caenimonas aquaedulcis TaxID=2793270 RepID=A0A931H1Q2_9BURK|nr:acyltransferase [Caenimonas aquaedulcis]
MSSPGSGRILGWDLLRGLCALGVASYHLMYWQDIAAVNTLGSYGVYMFFILSGASLAYNYEGKLSTPREAASFILVRWLRLAPLYILLCVVFVAMLSLRNGQWVDQLPRRFALNASFAFGFDDPAVWALLVGGWSLGIEFVYYLVFPLLLAALRKPVWCVATGTLLVLLQAGWVLHTAGSPAGYAASAVAYHQVPAFAAYFFGGCVIGHWRRSGAAPLSMAHGFGLWLAMGLLLVSLNAPLQGDELLGWRGTVLFCACFLVVFLSGQVNVKGRLAPVASWLGDITYGCYLLHPIFFFGFAWFVLPRITATEPASLAWPARLAILAGVLALSCLTAAASERWFESPLRRWGKRVMQGRPAAPYKDAASISS